MSCTTPKVDAETFTYTLQEHGISSAEIKLTLKPSKHNNMETSELTSFVKEERANAMSKIMLYAYNYAPDFLAKAFGDDTRLAEHFENKLDSYFNESGNGTMAFINTFLAMSGDNRIKLAKWIDKNFNA